VWWFLLSLNCRGDYTGRRRCYTLVLPSVFLRVDSFVYLLVPDVGEITQERRLIYYSRSPLSEPDICSVFLRVDSFVRCRGDYTGVCFKFNSRSPPSEPDPEF